jgi:hypothetical protein
LLSQTIGFGNEGRTQKFKKVTRFRLRLMGSPWRWVFISLHSHHLTSMSQQPPLSETQRRAIVEADLRKNRKLHQFLLQTQELLTKPNVPLAAFKASVRHEFSSHDDLVVFIET